MLWNIYDEDNDCWISQHRGITLDQAIVLLIEAHANDNHKTDPDFRWWADEDDRNRKWGIRLYPGDNEAIVELEIHEHRDFLRAGWDI